MPDTDPRLLTIFAEALERSDPAARAAYLDNACAADTVLRRQVEALLAAHADAGRFLEPASLPADGTAAFAPEPTTGSFAGSPGPRVVSGDPHGDTPRPDAGTVIAGKYKLVEEIGAGGMGSVWMAQQTEPVRRTVAVKLIKPGMDSRAVLARFEAERQALALMDHPNIAKVHDAGATPDGRPFFVMELVKGVPITQFCDDRRLTPRERLELFVPVCSAIQHAHQKGVIHRDIKPSNVLVALYDDRPVPKVIDFGVAKAAGQPLTEKTLATGFGAVVGTPEYMSPEQASFNNLDIDTRSDVYALGVLLYELLAGSPPFSRKDLEKIGLLEIFRAVREQEPPRPSTKLSTAEALPTLSANRGTEPKRLTALLRGELDWIVMKALEKDRNRRYESANAFAADVQRHLAGEPVQAVPPSAGYRLRKFLHKNRGPVLVAAVVFLALLVGIVGTTWGLIRADEARREEVAQRQTAERLKAESDTQRERAEEQQRLAEYRAASVTVDAALQFLSDREPREGLVRLAATLKTLPRDAVPLRQAVVTNLLVWGQRIAPPYPFVTDRFVAISPDGRFAIVAPEGDWEVRDTATGRKVASLGDEGTAVFDAVWDDPGNWAAFSADGSGAATIEVRSRADSVVRVWEVPSAKPEGVAVTWTDRARLRPAGASVRRVRLNRDGSRAATRSDPVERPPGVKPENVGTPIHLWDARTGRLVAALDHGDKPAEVREFGPDGRVLLTTSGKIARLWSAEDGRLLHTLDRHGEEIYRAGFSPSGKWVAVVAGRKVYWWNAETAGLDGTPVEIAPDLRHGDPDDIFRFAFSAEDVLIVRSWNIHGVGFGRQTGSAVCVRGESRAHDLDAVHSDGRHVLTDAGHVYALNPRRRLEPPIGRRFAPEARAAASGRRFVQVGERLIDLESEKPIGERFDRPEAPVHPLTAPGCAFVAEGVWSSGRFSGQTLIPAQDLALALPDDLLVLWARVVARGHLDRDSGLFVEDDETVWERNRTELVGQSAAVGEFPFPGPFAADRLFWVRQALKEGRTPEEMLQLVERLVAAEPSWRNYRLRAHVYNTHQRHADAIRSDLKARELGKREYNDRDYTTGATGGESAMRAILGVPDQPKDLYELALRWIDAVAPGRTDPEDTSLTLSRALALYRLGRDHDALRELARAELRGVASVVAGGWPSPAVAVAASTGLTERSSDFLIVQRVIAALCHHRLGQHAEARRNLASARTAHQEELLRRSRGLGVWGYGDIIDEALVRIEGRK